MEPAFGNENVVNINFPTQKKSHFLIVVFLFLFLVILAALSFGIGFLYGQISFNQNSTVLEKKTGQTSLRIFGEKKIFSDFSQKYKITFPHDWEVKERQGDIPGAFLKGKEATIEIWLLVKQTLTFSEEQKNAIEKTTKSEIKISQQKAQVVEYTYKAGNYFATIEMEATNLTPRTTFWIRSTNTTEYATAREIVSSFVFS